jgi:dihydrofolate synthase/folylpolyglutamate synthase
MSDHLRPADAALERLRAFHPKLIDLSLGRMLRLMEALGRPQDRLPPVVHVAGTNGKGSTIALLRAMTEADGRRVHVFTSPHLVRFAERIRLAGALIEEGALADVITRVEGANAGRPITFFEITAAAAFLAFSETPADLLLLEVGLGGRYDATNIVDHPEMALIATVDHDHHEFLGSEITMIAAEKAGIIKPSRPVIVGRQTEAALTVIERQAERLQAPLTALGRDYDAYAQHGRLVFQTEDALLDLPLPALHGAHQIDNAALAVAAARALGIADPAIASGLTDAEWPARLQRLTAGPLAAFAQQNGADLWLDGAHNPHGARALADWLTAQQARDGRPTTLVAGLMDNKDASAFFAAFVVLAPAVVTTPFDAPKARSAADLAAVARAAGLPATEAANVTEAVTLAARAGGRLVICGSLYLAGEALALSPETWPR